jgi:hypothetical protein
MKKPHPDQCMMPESDIILTIDTVANISDKGCSRCQAETVQNNATAVPCWREIFKTKFDLCIEQLSLHLFELDKQTVPGRFVRKFTHGKQTILTCWQSLKKCWQSLKRKDGLHDRQHQNQQQKHETLPTNIFRR